jgi:hypothetical protein
MRPMLGFMPVSYGVEKFVGMMSYACFKMEAGYYYKEE